MGKFALDIAQFGAKTKEKNSKIVRKICLDLLTKIVKRSPVDTGRFRANNQVNLNNVTADALLEFDKDGSATIRRGESVLGKYDLGDTVFLYNNVSYALALEFGHSQKQAPQGVYRISVNDIVTQFEEMVRRSK